jgi:hypothetical protein
MNQMRLDSNSDNNQKKLEAINKIIRTGSFAIVKQNNATGKLKARKEQPKNSATVISL